MRTFSHFGIPTDKPSDKETYHALLHMYRTAPETNAHNIELMRFADDDIRVLPEKVRTRPHIAYVTDSIEEEVKGMTMLFGPFRTAPDRLIAFAEDTDGIIVELIERHE